MRVALISPYNDSCLGLRYIASFLRQHGHEVWLIAFKQYLSRPTTIEQLEKIRRPPPGGPPVMTQVLEEATYHLCIVEPATDREYELLVEKMTEIRPDLVGISVVTATVQASVEITSQIRRQFPRLPIIWGGIHPTIAADQCIELHDLICLGEGEWPMVELAQDPERADIQGIWVRKDGKTHRNPIRPLEQNLDLFPYPLWGENEMIIDHNWVTPVTTVSDSSLKYFRGIHFTMTQRGCPFACTYCFNSTLRSQHKGERYVRRRSVDHVMGELEETRKKLGVTFFNFFDDIFVKDREWIEEFAEKYKRRIGIPFGGYAHPNYSAEDMIGKLVGAGMAFMEMGIESGSKYILKNIYNRHHDVEKIVELARLGEKYGLALIYEILSNCEYEREEDCLETLRLLLRLPKSYLTRVYGLAVFPRLPIAQLDHPRPCLSETTSEFWSLLYVLTHYKIVPEEVVLSLANDPYLKAHPETLRPIANALKEQEKQIKGQDEELARLRAEADSASLRGLARYAKRLVGHSLPQPVGDALRRVLAPLGVCAPPQMRSIEVTGQQSKV